jgi:hypothetical protein
MFQTLLVASLAVSAVAFRPASSSSRVSVSKLSMSSEFLPGALAPLGYFDPLGLSKDKTEGECKVCQCINVFHFILNYQDSVVSVVP